MINQFNEEKKRMEGAKKHNSRGPKHQRKVLKKAFGGEKQKEKKKVH